MVASMTGFGRAEKVLDEYRVTVEISSVNNRYLEWQIRLPKTLVELESKIKKFLALKIHRGKINFSLVVEDKLKAGEKLSLDTDTADMYFSVISELKQRFDLADTISLEHFLNLPDLITAETVSVDLQKTWDEIEPICGEALDKFHQMRLAEGQIIEKDFILRLDLLSKYVEQIRSKASNNVTSYRDRLHQKTRQLLADFPVDEQRIAFEAALAAEKMDVTEELVRLGAHIASFSETLREEAAVGKRLTFVLQEMLREANTIASKAADYEISSLVISIKDEVEKLREQVLNIE